MNERIIEKKKKRKRKRERERKETCQRLKERERERERERENLFEEEIERATEKGSTSHRERKMNRQ